MLNRHLLPLTEPSSPFIENYRRLHRKILYFYQQNHFKIFGITSAASGEGKTLTSINLALVMSEDPTKKVILVECDFRRPRIARYLGLPADHGFADVLTGGKTLNDAMATIKNGTMNLKILTAGKFEGDLTHLLHDIGLKDVMTALKEEYDFIIVDSPPVIPIADQAFLADLVDGIVLVIRASKTPRDMIQNALETIKEKNVIGIILNGFDKKVSNYYHYKYSHYYSPKDKAI